MYSSINTMKLIITTILMTSLLLSESATRGLLLKSNISPLDIYKNQWALLIGVNEYKEFTPLKYAVEDAKSIKTTLITQYGFLEKNIIFLTDNDATKINIQNAFYDLVEKTSKDDAVIVFFAGHGITRQNLGSKEDLGYLIPIDEKKII